MGGAGGAWRWEGGAGGMRALRRSVLNVLSLSTSAPQMAMTLSSSWAAAAATQGAGSTCGSVTGSALVARACCGGAAQSIQAIATRTARIENARKRNGTSLLTTAKRAVCIATNRRGIAAIKSDFATVASPMAKTGTESATRRARPCFASVSSTKAMGVAGHRNHQMLGYGGIALVAVKILNWPISATSAWHSFAG